MEPPEKNQIENGDGSQIQNANHGSGLEDAGKDRTGSSENEGAKLKSAAAGATKSANGEQPVQAPAAAAPSLSTDDIVKFINMAENARRKKKQEKTEPAEHKFWDTQPVPKIGQAEEENGPIETKSVEEVRPEPYNMPAGFEWCVVDVLNDVEIQEVYQLLFDNYVEDDDNMFRFDYSKHFLRWALTPPGYSSDFHIGVRGVKNGKLMGFISGVPARMSVNAREVETVEINFLCVHKKLRSKRLAPVLIKEVTRRVNRTNVWQAVYTAGVVLPKPVTSCRYYHRSLDPKKLIEVEFSRLPPRMTMARTIKLYKLPETTAVPGIRPMTMADVPSAHKLLMAYLPRFKLYPVMSEEDFAHWLLPREGVVDSFVVTDPATGTVTDLCSFYHLPSTVIGNDKHKTLFAAYSFYNVATTVPLQKLASDMLILARSKGMDVFNALNLMENESFLKELKFGLGDGRLQYYLYNWRCPDMEPGDVGLVLL